MTKQATPPTKNTYEFLDVFDANETRLIKGTRNSTKQEVWVLTNSHGQRVALTTQLIQSISDLYVSELQDDVDEIERQVQTYGGLA